MCSGSWLQNWAFVRSQTASDVDDVEAEIEAASKIHWSELATSVSAGMGERDI